MPVWEPVAAVVAGREQQEPVQAAGQHRDRRRHPPHIGEPAAPGHRQNPDPRRETSIRRYAHRTHRQSARFRPSFWSPAEKQPTPIWFAHRGFPPALASTGQKSARAVAPGR